MERKEMKCVHDQVNASDTIHTWCFWSAPGEHML